MDAVRVGNDWGYDQYPVTVLGSKNVIAIKGINSANGTHGAVIATLKIGDDEIPSSASWELSLVESAGWQELDGQLGIKSTAVEHGSTLSTTWWNRDSETLAGANFPIDSSAQWLWSAAINDDPVVYLRKVLPWRSFKGGFR